MDEKVEETPTVMEQLIAFMESNKIDYLETRQTKGKYVANTIIELHGEDEECGE